MELREIDNILKEMMSQSEAHKAIDRISHWLDRLRYEKYETAVGREMKTLENLERLGLVRLSNKALGVEAEITQSGMDVHKEMVGRGYYLKKGKS